MKKRKQDVESPSSGAVAVPYKLALFASFLLLKIVMIIMIYKYILKMRIITEYFSPRGMASIKSL